MILKLLVFPLVISFLAQTTAWLGRRRTVRKPVPPPRPGGCSYYKLLNTPDRFMKTPTVNVRCDKGDLTKFWYRFQGSAGTLIATVCPPVKHCGTHAPGWMTGKHPSKADGIVTRKVCYHWAADCCKWTNNIRVRNCSGFYIYELDKTPVCSLRYCGSGPDVDDCVGKPCKNGATCIDKHYSYECQCAVGYTGENCERKSVPPSACPTGDRIGCLTNATGFSLLPELLFTDSNKGSNVYSGVTIDWVNWNHYLATLTCRCAYNARKLGYEVFGLKISGECWSSNATNWKKSNNHLALSCSGKYKNISGQAQNICSWGDDIYYVYELLYYDVRVSRASVEDYISIKREIPTMTALTICTWIKTKDTRGSASMISYSEKGGSSNAVLLNNPVALWFWIGSVWKTGVSVADGEWHHVCTTWENVTGQTVTFKDGSRVANHTFKKGHVIKGGGILIIGQEQDKFGGGFQSSQNFIGDLFGINIWDNVLSDTNIEAMAVDSKMDVSGTVLNWDDVISGQKCGELQYVKASCKNVDRNFDIRVTRASVKDYVKLVTRQVPSMTAITICTWLKTLDSRSDATMISYAAKGSYNEVVLNIPKSLSFWIASSRWKTGVNVADNIWHHVCVTWENTAGQAAIFKDGNKTATHSFKKGHVIKADGILIVGQEQDKFGGGFQSSQNFIGDLFGITIWDRVLTAAEINTMAIDSNSDFSGNVLAWKDIPCQDIYGELKFIRPSLGKMPIASPGWYVLFDFENGQADLSKWTLTGTAFSNQPTYGDNPTARKKEPSNHKGNWWIGGAEDRPSPSDKAGAVQLDKPTGTMTSPHFTITGSKMRFLIGGGCAINWVRAELLIDGQVVDKATGKCSETMTTQEWEVEAQNFGKRAQVRLIDASSAGWGHINFDHFEMWYAPWTANYDIQFNRVSREDYVYVKKTLPRLTALTYCLWIKTADQNRARTIFSYKVPEAMYELILYYPQKLTYNLNNLQYNINVNVADDRWHHVCFTLDYKSQKVTLYKDGWSVKQNSLKGGTEIRPGGTLVIGQLQSTGSEFSYNWNYIGSLYGFNIWDKLLTAEEIKVMALDPKMDVSGNAISWSDIMSDAVYGKNNLIRKSSCRRSDANFDIKFTRASIKDYIKVKRPITSRIYSLSLCVWLKTADKRVGSGIFSYAVEGSDNEILLNQPKSLLFWIGSKSWNTGVNIADDRWHHVCVTWNQAAGQTAIFLDGKQASRTVLEPNHAIKYNQNSSIIIGQEQDKVGGGFQSTQNFIGELSGINLWRKILSLYEIEQMSLNPTKANEIQGSQGNVVQWTDAYCGYIGGETQVIDNQTSCKNTEIDFDIKFTRASAEDYVKISRPVPSMTAITLCVWLKTVDKRKASSVISYAVLGSTNEVLLNEPKSLLFWIGSSVWNTRLNVADGEWHHICGTWENSGGQALIYKDGQQAAKHAFKKGHVIKPNGALIIGQEQDSVGGGFQSTQNFIGELSGINIWNKVIRADEIKIMAIDYRANAAGNVLQWSDVFCEKKLGQTKIIKPTTSCKFINASAGWRVLFDFENDGLSKWTLTGTAFNNQPTYGDNPTARKREPSNHKGNWWIGGAENRPSPSDKAGAVQLDKPTGTMKSPPFRLTGTRLKFLISGGCGSSNKYSIYAGLYVRSGFYSRRILVTRPLRCSETMVEKEWSIQSHYLGSMAQVILVDSSTKGWGHINFDHLMMYEPPPVWTKLYDFEKGKDSLSTWTLTGTAFSNQPTYGDNPTARKKEPSNHKGNWWIGGAENRPSPSDKAGAVQLDKPQGNLTSPSFLITGYKLRFLIGGGCDSNVVRLELEVDEEIVAMATGKCLETMVTSEWDVSCYLGKLAKVRAVDQSSTGWGHINFDNIEMFSIVY